jgi:transposase
VQEANSSVGVRPEAMEQRRLRQYAAEALQARQQMRDSQRQLARLARGQAVLRAQARVVGAATACVLWASVGDPQDYPCGQAYRKAMGLNLTERSSGTHQGELHISKRGQPPARRWLYLSALRLVKREGLRGWYQAKKRRDAGQAKGAVVAVMRRLVLALHAVAVRGATFEARRLFPGEAEALVGPSETARGGESRGAQGSQEATTEGNHL